MVTTNGVSYVEVCSTDSSSIQSLEPRHAALVKEFIRAHRRMNGGIGSIELSHLISGAPDVDFRDGHQSSQSFSPHLLGT